MTPLERYREAEQIANFKYRAALQAAKEELVKTRSSCKHKWEDIQLYTHYDYIYGKVCTLCGMEKIRK